MGGAALATEKRQSADQAERERQDRHAPKAPSSIEGNTSNFERPWDKADGREALREITQYQGQVAEERHKPYSNTKESTEKPKSFREIQLEVEALARQQAEQNYARDPSAKLDVSTVVEHLKKYSPNLSGPDAQAQTEKLIASYLRQYNSTVSEHRASEPWYKRAWHTLQDWGKDAIDLAKEAGKAAREMAAKALDTVAEKATQAAKVAAALATPIANMVAEQAMAVVKDPTRLLGMGATLVRQTIAGLGLDRFAVGLKEAVVGACQLDFGRSWDGLKSMGSGVLQYFGINDIIQGIQTIYNNWGSDWKMVALGALQTVFGAAQGVAGLFGAGAAVNVIKNLLFNGAKQLVASAVKEGFETIAKDIGKEVMQAITDKVGASQLKETLQQTAKEAAQKSIANIDDLIKTQGRQALNHEAVKNITRETTATIAERTLRNLNVDKVVEEKVVTLLKDLNTKTVGELKDKLIKAGSSETRAQELAEKMKHALESGSHNDAMAEGLTKQISDDVGTDLTKRMKSDFANEFDRGVDRLGNARNLDGGTRKMMKAAGREGFEKGVREAIEVVVREGVERAIRQFRDLDAGTYYEDGPTERSVHDTLTRRAETGRIDQNELSFGRIQYREEQQILRKKPEDSVAKAVDEIAAPIEKEKKDIHSLN